MKLKATGWNFINRELFILYEASAKIITDSREKIVKLSISLNIKMLIIASPIAIIIAEIRAALIFENASIITKISKGKIPNSKNE